jgi:hypothetical protein
MSDHIGELKLRRHRAGESLGEEGAAIAAHAAACGDCRARLRALDDEQRRFEQEISFGRFAAGVERAARGASAARRPLARRAWLGGGAALAMAAAVAFIVTFKGEGPNRIKGGEGMIVRVSGADGQRTANPEGTESLSRGERLRLGYNTGGYRYLLALSVDEKGSVTALHPESGASVAVAEGPRSTTHFLPEAWELTGAGLERVVLLLSDRPIEVDAARHAAEAAFRKAGGDLRHLPPLGLPGAELSRTFSKP